MFNFFSLKLILLVSFFQSDLLFSATFEEQKIAASKGSPEAQLRFGRSLLEKSRKEGIKWIQKAADQGYGEAWYWLGYTGGCKFKNVSCYEKAGNAGYLPAYAAIIEHFIYRGGSEFDELKAKKYADLIRSKNIPYNSSLKNFFELIDICFEAGKPVIPTDHYPSDRVKKTFSGDWKECLYYQYGVGVSQSWDKYRHCLLSKKDLDKNDLAEIYANGWGVKRDVKLAIALVCHGESAPAEREAMLKTLVSTRHLRDIPNEFTFCNHMTSGYAMGTCSGKWEAISEKKMNLELLAITKNWSKKEKLAFQDLLIRAEDFFIEYSQSEQDLSGSAATMFVNEEIVSLRDHFLSSIKSFEKGILPESGFFIFFDDELNRIYNTILKTEKIFEFGTIKKDGIIKTQRKWIKYRDAWVVFASHRYSKVAPELWKLWLTRERINQLNKLTKSID